MEKKKETYTAGLVLGIVGICLNAKHSKDKKTTAGLVLSIIGLVLSVINSIVGVYIALR